MTMVADGALEVEGGEFGAVPRGYCPVRAEGLGVQVPRGESGARREGVEPREMKRQLEKSGMAGWMFINLLANFHLLIYLYKYLDVETDLLKICDSIADWDVPLNEGCASGSTRSCRCAPRPTCSRGTTR